MQLSNAWAKLDLLTSVALPLGERGGLPRMGGDGP